MAPLPDDVADSLAAAYDARGDIHFHVCTVYTAGPESGCSCGIPALIGDLFRLLGVEERDWRAVLYSSAGRGFAQSA